MRSRRWELALIGIAMLWGSTFVIVRDAVERTPPFRFLALRFAVATVVMAAAGAFRGLSRDDLRAGAAAGAALFAGYALQTVGQQYTSPSNAGFITGLFVIFTPLLGAAYLRRLPSAAAASGALLATAGLALLAMRSGLRLGRGDALELGCAVAFAVHFLLLGRFSPGRSAARLAAVQLATVFLLSGIWSAAAEGGALGVPGSVWGAIIATGVGGSALAFFVQTSAQRTVPPTRTAIIVSAEPVFAGIFGYLIAGDRLGARGYAGAALIIAGILVAELLAPARETV